MWPRGAARKGDEEDVVTGWRHVLTYMHRPRAKSRIKRRMRRRERHDARRRIARGEDE